MAIKKQHSGPRAGEDRMAFLERRLTRRNALKYGAAGSAAAVATLYAAPVIRTVHAQPAGGTPVPTGDETGYAWSGNTADLCFPEADNGGNWGWIHVRNGPFYETWTIYTGAGQCDITKEDAMVVGTVHVDRGDVNSLINGPGVTFTFFMTAGTLVEQHILVSASAPGTPVAPGSFTFIDDDGTPTNPVVIADPNPGGTIYIVVQVVVA